MNAVYWLCFALICVYVWIMVAAYRAARARRASDLVCRLAPYHGGWFPRTTEDTAEAQVIPFPHPGYSVKVPDDYCGPDDVEIYGAGVKHNAGEARL